MDPFLILNIFEDPHLVLWLGGLKASYRQKKGLCVPAGMPTSVKLSAESSQAFSRVQMEMGDVILNVSALPSAHLYQYGEGLRRGRAGR